MSRKAYGEAAGDYWERGWRGILPLPPGKKFPPPEKTTGYDGYTPSFADIMEWQDRHPDGNLALRLPKGIVGIDVDAYNGKRGDLTLAEAEKRWGELPPTVRSTSRMNSPSGIRLYRVPLDTELETVIRFPEMGLGHIEVIQFFHRYCVAWPSFHPETKQAYYWVTPEGNETDIPWPATLPELPEGWLEGLKRKPQAEITTEADVDGTLSNLPAGPMSMRVQDTLNRALTDLSGDPGSRHDVTLAHVGRLFRWADEGDGGVPEALEKLKSAFTKVVGKDRGTDAARLEFERMVSNRRVHDLIASTPGDKKADSLLGLADAAKKITEAQRAISELTEEEMDLLLFGPSRETSVALEDSSEDDLIFGSPDLRSGGDYDEDDDWEEWEEEANQGEEVVIRRTSWGGRNIAEALEGDLSPEEPLALRRADDVFLMYKGRVNALAGEPGSGKSWLALIAIVQALLAGERAFMLDFEDNLKAVLNRLIGLGVPKDVLARNFGYADPDGPLDPDAALDLARTLDELQPSTVLVDGINAAMGLVGLDMEKTHDFNRFNDLILRPLARRGCTVITVDHVTKSKDSRGGYAIGSQAKKAMCDGVLLSVRAVEKFGRGKIGRSEVFIDKDKNGGVQGSAEFKQMKGAGSGDYLASFTLDARTPNTAYSLFFDKAEDVDERGIPKGEQRLIVKMIEISNWLAANDPEGAGKTLNAICDAVPGRKVDLIGAVNQLIEAHHVEVAKGPRNSKIHILKSPYTGPEDADMELIMGTKPDL